MPRFGSGCQLCSNNTGASRGLPSKSLAIAYVAGYGLCAKHLERLTDIAAENGIRPAHFIGRFAEVTHG